MVKLWEMDNRGSKSNKGGTLFVKEQRADGYRYFIILL